jgi:uncharacterized protein YutE (UPF0331/DUF86 family)
MNGKLLLLVNSIRRDLEAIEGIYHQLERYPLTEETNEDDLIVIAYHLHNLYNAFENIFRTISTTFEDSAGDDEQWHAQLLRHMQLDLMPLRPAVIDDKMVDALDELRRFRHLFRHAYTVKLDPQRLALVLQKARILRTLYQTQMERFITFLESLSATNSPPVAQ